MYLASNKSPLSNHIVDARNSVTAFRSAEYWIKVADTLTLRNVFQFKEMRQLYIIWAWIWMLLYSLHLAINETLDQTGCFISIGPGSTAWSFLTVGSTTRYIWNLLVGLYVKLSSVTQLSTKSYLLLTNEDILALIKNTLKGVHVAVKSYDIDHLGHLSVCVGCNVGSGSWFGAERCVNRAFSGAECCMINNIQNLLSSAIKRVCLNQAILIT